MLGSTLSLPFSYSPHDLTFCASETEGLLEWAARAGEKIGVPPMLVAVSDPVAITAELATLIATRLEEHLTRPEEARPLAVSAAIGNIRQFIEEDAENRQIWKSEREARNVMDVGYMGM
ncbi:hypothetical protein SNE32_17735, partial [Lysobacter sp. D1-1-M9]|uniref:hypothetical protein n=1 Tax=Novilysobacter longmucuonensis TaxID=3098603 RepID=UPI002FCAC0AB